ncbi:hypothetical protein [Streptomyces sp. DSM 118878]
MTQPQETPAGAEREAGPDPVADSGPEAKEAGRPIDAGATAAPPEEDPAPDAWEAIEQLFTLAPHLRSGRANVMGDTQVSGDVVAGDKRLSLHLHDSSETRLHAVGPLPTAELGHLADTFAPTRRYDELSAALAEHRVLLLRGRPGTGRRTAALRMLMQNGPKGGEVIALDPGVEPGSLADHVRPGGIHVVVDPVTGPSSPLRDVHLNAVRRRLGEDGLLVVVLTHGTATEGVTAHDWSPPSATDVTRAHLRHAMRLAAAEAPTADAVPADTVQGLLELDASVAYLGSGPPPGETVGYARLLMEYAAGRCDHEELSRYGHTAAEDITSRWFGARHQPDEVHLRDKAFLISLAVFDGLPYPLVAELGDLLYLRLRTVEEPDRTAGYKVFGSSPADRLALARAEEYDDETDTPWGRLPERVVAFRNGSLWSTVLSHVWTSHPAIRRPLLGWFDGLMADGRLAVRLRAAVASGVLAAADFGHAYNSFLDSWGSSPRPAQRQLAAWALYTAADHGMDSAVRRLLSDWSRRQNPARRWTVARSYALLGGATATSALRDIGRMAETGPASDGALQSAYEQALEALLQGPAAVTVLEQLVRWHDSRGPLRELAAAGFLRGARRRRQVVEADTVTWPRLLRLAAQDATARQCVVAMWRALLGSRSSRDAARAELARWVRVAARVSARYGTASEVESALAGLLPLLVETQNDWERLDYLLRRSEAPDGPHGATTARLRAALTDGGAAPLPRPARS